MMSTSNEHCLRGAFGGLLKTLHDSLDRPYWFDLFDIDTASSNHFTLMKMTNLAPHKYTELLNKCDLARGLSMIKTDNWVDFLKSNNVDVHKIEPKKINGRRSYYMLIGPKENNNFAKDAHAQLKADYRPLKLSSNENVKQQRQMLEETINLV